MNSSGRGDKPAAANPGDAGKRRRRSATGKEQAKRLAWGKDWGQIGRSVAAQLRERTR